MTPTGNDASDPGWERIYRRDGRAVTILSRLPDGTFGNAIRQDLPSRPRAGRDCAVSIGSVPRVALTREEAAAAIGMSLDSFERHVQPTMRLVRLGRMRLVPVAELERWLAANATEVL